VARSRRRAKGSRRSKPRADWVYRDHMYDEAGALINSQGTYNNLPTVLAPAPANALGKILYDSKSFMKHAAGSTPFVPLVMAGSARAEGKRAQIMAVQGMISIRPSTWALGSNLVVGIRFGVFEQDPGTGGILVDPSYSMFASFANVALSAANWANDGQWDRERRVYVTFSDNSQVYNHYFFFRTRRFLKGHECYAVYLEANNQSGTTGSVNSNVTLWLRTLVSDEG